MFRIDNITIPAGEFELSADFLKKAVSSKLGINSGRIKKVLLLRKSLDARKKDIKYNISVAAEIEGKIGNYMRYEPVKQPEFFLGGRNIKLNSRPVIVGFGPAGIFAALILARNGTMPIILERGQDVDTRKKDVLLFFENGKLNTSSNVQFGEGGAGTFSDGKLTTGIKSPYIEFILREFVKHGAPEDILYEAKPHIGTDLLAETIKNIRQEITSLGGEIIFGARFLDFSADKDNKLTAVVYEKENSKHEIKTEHLILAIGHSARDTYEMLYSKGIEMTAKPFSVGVRIEHLQRNINLAMYGETKLNLPPADYKTAVKTGSGRGVYTFCMCPGGYVQASSSEEGTIVTNGMSYNKRDGNNANSALLVNVLPSDFFGASPLAGIEFQRKIEHKAFIAAGSDYKAPVVLYGDFAVGRNSAAFGEIKPTYRPGTVFVPPDSYLPPFVCDALREAVPMIGQKIKGFDAPDALLTGPETRSSAPVRIERGDNLQSAKFGNIYPCGEGAGYAGGIMSAAADGLKAACSIIDGETVSVC